ncbi:glycoside hydrolase family 43 protein [Synoicihabitans lomoniglobus]|uniref:Glycoside hydrolase 43 family protein n=1 Tax=Synoicihabitans lomoniglobus TaxID=2909285 RepID=A0AAF0CLQ2_9BACT|nr:glycoside hydrolase 43 family protein [Opitutaceae bacterium LMO-M01]WED63123.1 glycoside hydrolase 43 family protein [Opitutaceae bacterium LMO-M01]
MKPAPPFSIRLKLLLAGLIATVATTAVRAQSWTADNGNGTYTNPLFYDEFSDPDLIRVGDDFYLAGTTMHSMPGLVVLHSRDLVNWSFLSYAFDRLEMGPEFHLDDGKEIYGQGIWAPCIRYHDGKFYLFSNINGKGLQVFSATNPAGPWEHRNFEGQIYDLSVLFDDDGRIYAVHGYDEVIITELKPDLSGVIAGSDRVVIPRGNAMGEGHHFYKIDGKYFIISANYAPTGRMQAARADTVYGPYETVVIAGKETLGTTRAAGVQSIGIGRPIPEPGFAFEINDHDDNFLAAVPMHQGGIVQLPNGDWWGFSMLDFHSVGRTTALSPVTWQDGWPFFGLSGNLGRSPRTWFKPDLPSIAPHAPYQRSTTFDGDTLPRVWQWNHNPVDAKWSLTEQPGSLRLHTLPATQFLWARNSLTQRAIGPTSVVTAELDGSGLQPGDTAGLALLNIPFASLGLVRNDEQFLLRWYDQFSHETIEQPIASPHVFLRASGDYDRDFAQLSYSTDGTTFTDIGGPVRLPYQLKTFQGTRHALFAFNTVGQEGGYADFASFAVDEPLADRSRNIPLGQVVTFTNLGNDTVVWANPHGMLHSAASDSGRARSAQARFRVHDRGKGRVALEAMDGSGFLTVMGAGLSADIRPRPQESADSLFLWQDMLRDRQFMLLSLKTNRFVGIDPTTGEPYGADWPGARPDRRDGTVLTWHPVASD